MCGSDKLVIKALNTEGTKYKCTAVCICVTLANAGLSRIGVVDSWEDTWLQRTLCTAFCKSTLTVQAVSDHSLSMEVL